LHDLIKTLNLMWSLYI